MPAVVSDATPTRFPYSGAVDGLRGLAMAAIFCYHLGYPWARGSFLSVDLFFALSGFLITTLLVLERRRTGTIALGVFWARRARRLLPALCLTLILVAWFTRTGVEPWRRTEVRGDGIAGLLYVANWRFVLEDQSYFGMFGPPSPLRHLWTLAIEEQFYLLWPLVVAAALAAGKGSLRFVGVMCAGGIVASTAVLAITYEPGDPIRAYYGTDARAGALLAGALLALVLASRPPGERGQRLLRLAGPVALVLMLVLWRVASGTEPGYYRGGALVHHACVCTVLAAGLHPGLVRGVLSWGPLPWVGRLSYGIYLFHWPVIVWLVPTRVPLDGLALDALRLGVTLVVAVASYYLLELPVRERRAPRFWTMAVAAWRGRRASLVPGRIRGRWLALPGVGATVVAVVASAGGAASPPNYLAGEPPSPALLATASSAEPAAPGDPTVNVNEASYEFTWNWGDPLFCGEPRPEETAAARAAAADGPAPRGGAGLDVLLVGDSTSCSLFPGLAAVAEQAGARVREASVFGCGVASGEVASLRGEQVTPNSDRCPAMVDLALLDAFAETTPDVVVWMSIWEKSDPVVDGVVVDAESPAGRAVMLARMDAALARLSAGGTPVILLTVAAAAPNDASGLDNTSNAVDDAGYVRLDDLLDDFVAAHPRAVTLVDLAERLCPDGPPCPREVNGAIPRPDGRHFSPEAATAQARWLWPRLIEVAERRASG